MGIMNQVTDRTSSRDLMCNTKNKGLQYKEDIAMLKHQLSMDGYIVVDNLSSVVIEMLRDSIIERCNENLGKGRFLGWSDFVMRYETVPFVHEQIASKNDRLINGHYLDYLSRYLEIFFFSKFFGETLISDEEGYGQSEIYWRIVRPGRDCDIGPLHCDSWFWEANKWVIPSEYRRRFKMWLPLETAIGRNGLLVMPKSHRQKSYKYMISTDGKGKARPKIVDGPGRDKLFLLDVPVGSAVVFDDNLLHGGAPNDSDKIRVSVELTVFVK